MAFPGIKSTNTVGLAEFSGALVGGAVTAASARPVATLDEVSAGRGVEVGHYDAYGLALNVTRRLYDHGIAVEGSPALANLVARTTAVINHFDLDRLGLSTGDVVQVNAPKGPLSLSVVLSDDAPRGTIGVVFGSLDDEGHAGTTAALYDPASVITQMKLETT
jgi:anaerobic selenocysteine-containing dehydrogenase